MSKVCDTIHEKFCMNKLKFQVSFLFFSIFNVCFVYFSNERKIFVWTRRKNRFSQTEAKTHSRELQQKKIDIHECKSYRLNIFQKYSHSFNDWKSRTLHFHSHFYDQRFFRMGFLCYRLWYLWTLFCVNALKFFWPDTILLYEFIFIVFPFRNCFTI